MHTDPAEQLISVAEQWMQRLWNQRDLTAIDALHAPDFVDYSPAGRGSDNAAYRAGIAELYAAFPDWSATTDDLVVDARTGSVAIRWHASGTHAALFMGVPASGKRISFTGMEIIRIAGQRITARWGEWNGIEILEQLGA